MNHHAETILPALIRRCGGLNTLKDELGGVFCGKLRIDDHYETSMVSLDPSLNMIHRVSAAKRNRGSISLFHSWL